MHAESWKYAADSDFLHPKYAAKMEKYAAKMDKYAAKMDIYAVKMDK